MHFLDLKWFSTEMPWVLSLGYCKITQFDIMATQYQHLEY